MLYLRVNDILKQKGKSKYWLSKQTGITYPTIHKICENKTLCIRFDTLEILCKALNCSINDLFDSDNQQIKKLLK